MKKAAMAILMTVLVAPAFAVIGTVDDVPAASLLLPYFEVDLDDPSGVTTLMSINNASASAVLVHVTVWTDLSVHVLDFNVYLTGYDVQSINLRDVIVQGNLPVTASVGQDPSDSISPQGPISQDINFASCSGILAYDNPALDATYLDHVQSSLTGQPSTVFFGGSCAGVDHGDRIARGYVTADTVNACSLDFPGDVGYFLPGGTGVATNQNVIWGDYFYVNPGENFAQGETLVHLEADALLGPANYTFYSRLAPGGADNREALSNVFAVRYLNGGAFDGGTSLLVWRDSKRIINPFNCALVAPAPFELSQNQVVVFDEEENLEVPEGCTISPCPTTSGITPFPWETQRTHVSSVALPTTYEFGWVYLNLNSTVVGSVIPFEPLMQNWVTAVMDAKGTMSVGFTAVQLSNVTDPATASDAVLAVP